MNRDTNPHFVSMGLAAAVFSLSSVLWAGAMNLDSYKTASDFAPDANPGKSVWAQTDSKVHITYDWQGKNQYLEYETTVKSLWSEEYLYVLFIGRFDELALEPSIKPDNHGDCWGIWDYDVVEMFIGDGPDIRKYSEFVVSPLGQKIDISHDKNKPSEQSYETEWQSGWQVATNVNHAGKYWVAEMRIPFETVASGVVSQGKKFRANFYRCAEVGKNRKYMALNPTQTETPSFHHPEKFGTLTLLPSPDELPSPVLFLDFEQIMPQSDQIVPGEGVAGTNCFNMTDPGKGAQAPQPLIIKDAAVLGQLDGVMSITVTGWLRRKVDFSRTDATLPYILNCPGHFQLLFGRWGRLAMLMTGEDGRRKQIWSSWIGNDDLNPHNRWIFFAATYDATKGGSSASIYVGYEIYPILRDTFGPADAGRVDEAPDDQWLGATATSGDTGRLSRAAVSELIIGAANIAGDSRIGGMVDNIRIYASENDGSGALSQVQVEKIRQIDLGEKWIEAVTVRQAKEEERKRNTHWAVEDKYWAKQFNVHQVDILDRIFIDQPPTPLRYPYPRSVPKGASISFQFASLYRKNAQALCSISLLPPKAGEGIDLKGKTRLYELIHVPVEANNNGGIRTAIYSRPPPIWMESIVREAPFMVAEVMNEANVFALRENNMHAPNYKGVLVDVHVAEDAEPGIYTGALLLNVDKQAAEVPFSFRVHETVIGAHMALNNVHWLKAQPQNLTTGCLPEMWSDEHWELLRNSGRILHEFGQNTISISLMGRSDETIEFIRTIRRKDGSYQFDFELFDKWFETFRGLGFTNFEGACTFGGHEVSALQVWALDKASDNETQIFSVDSDLEEWFDFMRVFYTSLYEHLQAKGWTRYYYQAVCDEPTDMENYKRAYALTKECMPQVRTKEACGNGDYSPYIDIQVFNVSLQKAAYQELAKQRRAHGKGVWLYHCASPYPPYPNRHLDDPLTSSRLFPWLAYLLNADGYLFWAANNYRGADPYRSSIGPLPHGVVNPGHPPGDDWMYYPGPDGLQPSMRMLAFRDGLTDHALLTMLAKKDRARADEIMSMIAKSILDYTKEPEQFHRARTVLLQALDARQSGMSN